MLIVAMIDFFLKKIFLLLLLLLLLLTSKIPFARFVGFACAAPIPHSSTVSMFETKIIISG
jgi:hypothetical protein